MSRVLMRVMMRVASRSMRAGIGLCPGVCAAFRFRGVCWSLGGRDG
jgi:hypothetical protein